MNKSISKITHLLYRNRWIAISAFISVFGGLVVYLLMTPRLYLAKVRLILDEKPASSISPLGKDISQTSGDNNKALATQEELIRSKKVLSKAILLYKQSQDAELPDITLGNVKKEISTQTVPGTQILEISFRHQDPTATVNLLNLIAKGVVQENSETIRSEARATREFLENQIPHRQQQLVSIEASISQFKQKYNIVSLAETDNKRLTTSIAEAEKISQQISADLRQSQARRNQLSKVIGKSNSPETYQSIRTGQHPDLINLRNKLVDVESQLNAARENLTEEHPEFQKLLKERNASRFLYQQRLSSISNSQQNSPDINNDVASDKVTQDFSEQLVLSGIESNELKQKLISTQDHLSKLNARRQQYPSLEKTLASLNRQMETASQSVKLLKQKLDEARIAEAQLVSNLRIIEEAEKAGNPAFPNVPSLLFLGTVAAFLFSTGIVLVIDGMDNKLRDVDDIEGLIDLPLLGVIPIQVTRSLEPTPSFDLYSDPPLFESFRALSKNIQYRNDTEGKVVIVTSAISGEGKSHIASNLAVLSAIMSRKTLLIDADFRRPSIHSAFKLSREPGLLDVLKDGSEEAYSNSIKSTSIRNLSVMTSGKFSFDYITSFESGAVDTTLTSLAKEYEFIVVDTPPVMACSDVLTLGHDRHQTIMVARLDITPTDVFKRAVNILESNDINLSGLVVNGGTSRNNNYYQYLKNDYQLAS